MGRGSICLPARRQARCCHLSFWHPATAMDGRMSDSEESGVPSPTTVLLPHQSDSLSATLEHLNERLLPPYLAGHDFRYRLRGDDPGNRLHVGQLQEIKDYRRRAGLQCWLSHIGATCNLPHVTCNRQHATCSLQHAICHMRYTTALRKHVTCGHAACNLQHVPCNLHHTTSNMQHIRTMR